MIAAWLLRYLLAAALASLLALAGRATGPAVQTPSGGMPSALACGANPGPPRNATDPAIVVSAPRPGAVVSSPLTVAGQARVFEAVVSVALLGPGGDLASGRGVIARTSTMAAAGAPAMAAFSASLPFDISAPTDACLLVYEASARDGSPQNVVQIPLRLQPARPQ